MVRGKTQPSDLLVLTTKSQRHDPQMTQVGHPSTWLVSNRDNEQ